MSDVKELEEVGISELSETNAELADFLGESASTLPVPVATIDTDVIENNKMDADKPDKLSDEADEEIKMSVNAFVEKVKEDASDMTLSSLVYKIGEKSANTAMPHVSLYDNLIAQIMDNNQKGPEVKGSKDYNILRLKRELDLVNPAVLAKTPIKQKFMMILSKSALPGSEKIMDMIYERKETVKTATDGIKVALLKNANDLDKQLADLMMIYKGLLASHLILKGEIYQAQLIYNQVVDLVENISDVNEKQNIETVLADLTTQINSLIVEENMNAQFFAGSQLTAKLVREQQNQIRILVRQMEKAVLVNLGLRVVAKGLENSVNQSKALGDAIATTIADTAKANEKTADKLIKARTEGYIDLSKLQEGVESLERTFEKEAKANALIIKQGLVISKNVRATTQRLEKRINTSMPSEKF